MKKKDAEQLMTLSKRELLARAGELKIRRRHALKKSELINAVTAALQARRTERPKQKALSRAAPPAAKPGRSRLHTAATAEVVAMAVDQHRIHCYWDGAPEGTVSRAPGAHAVLRVHELPGEPARDADAVRTYDIGISGVAGSRYVDLPLPGRTYRVELGVLDARGYRRLAGAPAIRLPRAMPDTALPRAMPDTVLPRALPDAGPPRALPDRTRVSPWNIADADFQQLYDLSGVRSLRLGGRAAGEESLSSPGLNP